MTTPTPHHHHLHAPTAQKTPYRVSSTTNFNVLRSYLLTTTDISQTASSSQSSNNVNNVNGKSSASAFAGVNAGLNSAGGKYGHGGPRVMPAPPPNTPMGSRSATPATSPRRTGFVGVEGSQK